MGAILKIKAIIDSFLGYFTGGILMIMAIIITYTVIDRFLGGSGAWVEEIVRAGVVWTTFLGSYVAIATGKDIRVEIFTDRMPKGAKQVCVFVSEIIVIIFLVLFVQLSFAYVAQFAGYKLPMTGMSRGLLYSVFPFGGCMMLLHYVLSLIVRIEKLVNQGKIKEVEGSKGI